MNTPTAKRSFFAELQRRNVYKVGAMYAVAGWLVVQIVTQVLPVFEVSALAQRIIVLFIIAGFPVALVLSWIYELTPQGIVKTDEVVPDASITRHTGQQLNRAIIGVLVAAVLVLLAKLFWPHAAAPQPGASASDKSIAVLPFENLSRDPDNAYFAEGIQDEILTRLAKIGALKVISRTSTAHYASSPDNLPEIARQLGVATILEGSVQKSKDQVRVNVQLINAMTDAHLWADIYDRKLTDIFAVESDIARTIADTLQARLTGSEQSAIAARPTENPEAYQLYLKGRFFWNKRTAVDLRTSIDYFNQAIGKDPNYARAYAALAQAWMLLPAYNGGAPEDCFPQAETAARHALALDDNLADAHTALASIKSVYDFDNAGAIPEYERALQLDPNDATTHHWFANDALANSGQSARELAEMQRALQLDPLSLIINVNVGAAYLHKGQLDAATAQLRKAIALDRSFYYGHWNLGVVLELQGKRAEAIAEYQQAIALSKDPVPMGLLAHIYGTGGRKDEARKIIEQLQRMRGQQYTSAYSLAVAYLGLGDRNEAVSWLEQAYRERDGFTVGPIRIDPILAALHGDPRFEALAEKIVPARDFAAAASK